MLGAMVKPAVAQKVFVSHDSIGQHIFTYAEIESFEDAAGNLTIDRVMAEHQHDFRPSPTFNPDNENQSSAYWYRIKVQHNPETAKRWVIEFFDQTIDAIDFYTVAPDGSISHHQYGDRFEFSSRPYRHKNFVIPVNALADSITTYYFRVKSEQQAEILVVLRSADYLFEYALDEYFFFGIFYGMILVFSFYNLIMYAAVRESHYLFYILYLIGIGLYEMSADGIAFQYLWPHAVNWNQYAPGFALFLASSASLFFASSLLNLKRDEPGLYRLLMGVFIFRTIFFVLSLFVFPAWFTVRFIDILPFLAALYTGIYRWRKGYAAARFLVIAYAFLFYGVVVKISLYFNINWMPFGQLSHYSLGFCFIMEMIFLSFAISDKIRMFRLEKEVFQERTIEQLHENQRLKDNLNVMLEEQVQIKTAEIEKQNHQLAEANKQLEEQAKEIAEINALLAKDNIKLKHDVTEEKEARVFSKELTYQEFCEMHPDDSSWLEFLAELKWRHGYTCRKCKWTSYSPGRSPHSRRCTKCGYNESATAYTLLQNTHLPVSKALYLIFLVYNSQGTVSSHRLSEILDIRQSTCWAYSSKIKSLLKEKHKVGHNNLPEGWKSLILFN
jgi:hypothetical protein